MIIIEHVEEQTQVSQLPTDGAV